MDSAPPLQFLTVRRIARQIVKLVRSPAARAPGAAISPGKHERLVTLGSVTGLANA